MANGENAEATEVTLNPKPEERTEAASHDGNLLVLAALAVATGAVSGLVASLFRLCLGWADHYREAGLAWAHNLGAAGFALAILVPAGATALAAWLVTRFSVHAKGSGIPHVEAVLAGEAETASERIIPVKFFGGLLAMGSGLALGREGPSVQMGACIGHLVGKLFRRDRADVNALLAAGAGAGLATAFNAPLAGAVFVLEELVRRFDTRVTITTLGTSAGAIAVAGLILGIGPDFHVAPIAYATMPDVLFYLVLGIVMGLAGIVYNYLTVVTLIVAETRTRWPAAVRAAGVGAVVGGLAWWAPHLVGGGEPIIQHALDAGGGPLLLLAGVGLLRLLLGAVSYAAGTPGGLFAPMLVVGLQAGMCYGVFCQWLFPGVAPPPIGCAIVGMATLFASAVRAPVTGMVLLAEMTGNSSLLLPMLAACFTAMTVPTLTKTAPIYDMLRRP